MQLQAIASLGIIAAAIGYASLNFDGTPQRPKKLAGNSEACTYRAGPKDQELVEEAGSAGRAIVRSILMLERKCEFVTLVLPDGSRTEMKLGRAGRKPGEKGPSSTGYELDY